MKITALIRTHKGREELTKRAIQSCIDNGIDYSLKECNVYPPGNYDYNLDCNYMKSYVFNGYFFFLDSDDYILKDAIKHIKPFLREDKALIVQMLRNGKPKPSSIENIRRNRMGLPCLILHSKYKHIADLTNTETGDWDWINAVINKIPYDFMAIPVVDAGKRSRGK